MWDLTKPVYQSNLVSSEIRENFRAWQEDGIMLTNLRKYKQIGSPLDLTGLNTGLIYLSSCDPGYDYLLLLKDIMGTGNSGNIRMSLGTDGGFYYDATDVKNYYCWSYRGNWSSGAGLARGDSGSGFIEISQYLGNSGMTMNGLSGWVKLRKFRQAGEYPIFEYRVSYTAPASLSIVQCDGSGVFHNAYNGFDHALEAHTVSINPNLGWPFTRGTVTLYQLYQQ